jgi:hypothetical protein
MNAHPYLRAYMAGIVVPTLFLLVAMTVFVVTRFVYHVPVPIERLIVFPMALVPNLFGAWNMLYLWLSPQRRLPIGFHGALLPFVVVPVGLTIVGALGFLTVTPAGWVFFDVITIYYSLAAAIFPVIVFVYYLVWKHLVGFFNQVLGIA